jgi:alpha-methylacyl-CoA racemase
LGLGPEVCLQRNPRLIYGRMTGWGQEGPMAQVVGHDINYLALTGALHAIGEKKSRPIPPLNLVADLGGGAMYLVAGILAAVIESKISGKGQVVDAAMIDGVSNLMTAFFGFKQENMWSLEREDNFVDGGAPFYRTYETSDGKFVAVGAIEARFYQDLLKGMGLENETLPSQNDRSGWPQLEQFFSDRFKTKSRDEWVHIMGPLDACFSPVLDMDEAMEDPHMKSRKVFTHFNGVTHPSPAPRFQRTPASLRYEPPVSGQHSRDLLLEWGFDQIKIEEYLRGGVLFQS